MVSMNISLPDAMRDWVQEQIDSGKYASASDYVRDLIRHDQEYASQFIQNAISEGLESGISDRSMDDLLREAKSKAKATATS